MKFENSIRRALIFLAVTSLSAMAAGSPDNKEKPKLTVVDSGSFGVFMKGQRVATETFSVELQNGNSSVKSQLKEVGGSDAEQKSDMELGSGGEILRYEWSQSGGASLTVLPDNEFLKEKITTSNSAKPAEQAFLLAGVTPILDNNFFIHRELLVWKYLQVAPCKDEKGHRVCQPADFGALVPLERTSMSVRMELIGKEKTAIRGTDRELLRLNLHGEQFDWALWVDENDHFKLMKVAIPAASTEVVRD